MRHDWSPEFETDTETPYFDDEYEDEEYTTGVWGKQLNQAQNPREWPFGEVEEWERLMSVSELMHDCEVGGEGKGKQIVGAFAVLLETEAKYGFQARFWRVDEGEALPDGWEGK